MSAQSLQLSLHFAAERGYGRMSAQGAAEPCICVQVKPSSCGAEVSTWPIVGCVGARAGSHASQGATKLGTRCHQAGARSAGYRCTRTHQMLNNQRPLRMHLLDIKKQHPLGSVSAPLTKPPGRQAEHRCTRKGFVNQRPLRTHPPTPSLSRPAPVRADAEPHAIATLQCPLLRQAAPMAPCRRQGHMQVTYNRRPFEAPRCRGKNHAATGSPLHF
jgi:hypothetical protein